MFVSVSHLSSVPDSAGKCLTCSCSAVCGTIAAWLQGKAHWSHLTFLLDSQNAIFGIAAFVFIFLFYVKENALWSLKAHWIWLITLNKSQSSLRCNLAFQHRAYLTYAPGYHHCYWEANFPLLCAQVASSKNSFGVQGPAVLFKANSCLSFTQTILLDLPIEL